MSYNLADLPKEQRQAIEDEKKQLFDFWHENIDRARALAGRIVAEKGKRKGKWQEWADEQIAQLEPAQFQNMVRREVSKEG